MLRSLAQTANGNRGKAHIVIKANIGFSKRELDHGDFWTVYGKLFARFLVPDWTKAIVADISAVVSKEPTSTHAKNNEEDLGRALILSAASC